MHAVKAQFILPIITDSLIDCNVQILYSYISNLFLGKQWGITFFKHKSLITTKPFRTQNDIRRTKGGQ